MASMVLITGPSGAGKSTLAEIAASVLSAPVLAWDWVMAAMTSFDDVQAGLIQDDPGRHRALAWSILFSQSIAQLRAGRSVVLDGVARDAEVSTIRQIAADAAARSLVVWTECSDREVHRTRIEGRVRGIPGRREPDWPHADALRTSLVEPTGVDLRLDAVNPLSDNRDRLRQALLQG